MGVKKLWTIYHACGYMAEADLTNRAADRRAGYARWLTGREPRREFLLTRESAQPR